MRRLEDVELYAWVGEDEFGSGEIGLKQADCPAGRIPMVATTQAKMSQDYIVNQLRLQSLVFGKTIRLVRFTMAEVVMEVQPEPGVVIVKLQEPEP